MDAIKRITSLNRILDPRYPTNLAIVVLAVFSGAITLFARYRASADILASLTYAMYAGLAVFLAWALSRELDPDHELSAFVAAFLALSGYFFLNPPNLLALLFLLMIFRMLVRTVGPPVTPFDSLLIFTLGAWLAFKVSWVYGLVAAAGFLLDGILTNPVPRQVYFAAVMLLVTLLSIHMAGSESLNGFGNVQILFVAFVILLFVPFFLSYKTISSTSDWGSLQLFPARLKAAQILALLAALGTLFFNGTTSLIQLMPLWTAVFGVSLFFLGRRLLDWNSDKHQGADISMY